MDTISTTAAIVNRARSRQQATGKAFNTRTETRKLQRQVARLNSQHKKLLDAARILAAIAQFEKATVEPAPGERLQCSKCRCAYSSTVKPLGSRCNSFSYFDAQLQRFVRTSTGCTGTVEPEPVWL